MQAVHPGVGIETEAVSFGTEAGIFQGLGISVVVSGPGSIKQTHRQDECVSVDQMARCLDMSDRLSAKLAQHKPSARCRSARAGPLAAGRRRPPRASRQPLRCLGEARRNEFAL